jgi:hypothetical protein
MLWLGDFDEHGLTFDTCFLAHHHIGERGGCIISQGLFQVFARRLLGKPIKLCSFGRKDLLQAPFQTTLQGEG